MDNREEKLRELKEIIFILLIFLFVLLLVLSLAIWRNLKNGDG